MSVATDFNDREPKTCSRCAYFLSDGYRSAPTYSCPGCGREIANLSGTLSRVATPAAMLDLIPESVAREDYVIGFDRTDDLLVLVADIRFVTDWTSSETIEKLRFILNANIKFLHADRKAIRQAIDRDYGR